jgi:hypothetical protein
MRLDQLRHILRDEIAKEMQKTAEKLTAGRPADYAEYKQGVGRLQGHRDAMDCVEAYFEKLLDNDEGE